MLTKNITYYAGSGACIIAASLWMTQPVSCVRKVNEKDF